MRNAGPKRRTGRANPAAIHLLELCSLLAPDGLPVHQFLDHADRLSEPLATAARDPISRREALGVLFQAGLLTDDVDDTARLHRLIQVVIADQLLPDHRALRVGEVVRLLAMLLPVGRHIHRDPATWPVRARLLPHAQTLIEHANNQQLTTEFADLLTVTGDYLRVRGLDLRQARAMHERALTIRRQLYNGDHPEIASSLANLGLDLRTLGEERHACELHEQALAMRQRLYQGDHPSLAQSLGNLGTVQRLLGNVTRARELHEEALSMHQRLYQGDHRLIALVLDALAADLRMLGDPQRAQDLEEQALSMRQRLASSTPIAGSLGPDAPAGRL